MKYFFFIFFLFISYLGFSQDYKISLEELDSLTAPISFTELSTSNGHVPIYKGCKRFKTNIERKNCMSESIVQLFQENFNTEMHEESDYELGLKRISLIFKIDTLGHVGNIRARAEDQYLEAEAIRVARLIPQMKPAMLNGKPIEIPYAVPILVEMVPNKNEGQTKFPVYRGCESSKSNEELEACSKKKIKNFLKMSFDIELASRALPTVSSTQFLVEFTINKKGKIENINAKANHKAIAIEAIRVAKRLPKFVEPGIWEGVAVDTPYSLLMTLYF